MGNSQKKPKPHKSIPLNLKSFELCLTKLNLHVKLARDRRSAKLRSKEKQLVQLLSRKTRNQKDEYIKGSSIVSDQSFVDACNIVMRFIDILKDKSINIVESRGDYRTVNEIVPYLISVLWAGNPLNIPQFKELYNMMYAFYGPGVATCIQLENQVDAELKSLFKNLMPQPNQVNNYFRKFCDKYDLDVDKFNAVGHQAPKDIVPDEPFYPGMNQQNNDQMGGNNNQMGGNNNQNNQMGGGNFGQNPFGNNQGGNPFGNNQGGGGQQYVVQQQTTVVQEQILPNNNQLNLGQQQQQQLKQTNYFKNQPQQQFGQPQPQIGQPQQQQPTINFGVMDDGLGDLNNLGGNNNIGDGLGDLNNLGGNNNNIGDGLGDLDNLKLDDGLGNLYGTNNQQQQQMNNQQQNTMDDLDKMLSNQNQNFSQNQNLQQYPDTNNFQQPQNQPYKPSQPGQQKYPGPK